MRRFAAAAVLAAVLTAGCVNGQGSAARTTITAVTTTTPPAPVSAEEAAVCREAEALNTLIHAKQGATEDDAQGFMAAMHAASGVPMRRAVADTAGIAQGRGQKWLELSIKVRFADLDRLAARDAGQPPPSIPTDYELSDALDGFNVGLARLIEACRQG